MKLLARWPDSMQCVGAPGSEDRPRNCGRPAPLILSCAEFGLVQSSCVGSIVIKDITFFCFCRSIQGWFVLGLEFHFIFTIVYLCLFYF